MRPLGGVNAVILGAGPAHAFYFSAYEGIKSRFSSKNSLQNHLVNGKCYPSLTAGKITVLQMFSSVLPHLVLPSDCHPSLSLLI